VPGTRSQVSDSRYPIPGTCLRKTRTRGKLDARIAEKRRFTDRDNERFARRLRKRRRHLLRFLRVEGVEATNNRAERALRPAVLVRKTGGCNKTPLTSVRTAPARLPPLFPPPVWDTS
jgi:hypothetical protein